MNPIKQTAVIAAFSVGLIFSAISIGSAAFAQQQNTTPTPSTTGQLTAGNIVKGEIKGGNITKGNVQNETVTGGQIQGEEVTGANVTDAEVNMADISGANLTGAKLQTGSEEAEGGGPLSDIPIIGEPLEQINPFK